MSYHGWGRFDRRAFWAWMDAGCPQRWAFWRARDELDGILLGVGVGLLLVALILTAVAVVT